MRGIEVAYAHFSISEQVSPNLEEFSIYAHWIYCTKNKRRMPANNHSKLQSSADSQPSLAPTHPHVNSGIKLCVCSREVASPSVQASARTGAVNTTARAPLRVEYKIYSSPLRLRFSTQSARCVLKTVSLLLI